MVSEEVKVDSISSDTYNGKVLKVFPKSSTKVTALIILAQMEPYSDFMSILRR